MAWSEPAAWLGGGSMPGRAVSCVGCRSLRHWITFLLVRRVAFVSPLLDPCDPGYISLEAFIWCFAEFWAFAATWLVFALLTSMMLRRRTAAGSKATWYVGAFLAAPIVCPLCYFTKLRSALPGNDKVTG